MTIVMPRSNDEGLDTILIGQSLVMHRLRARIAQVAPLGVSVLLTGPTGAGKELVAHALHLAGRGSGPFVPVNVCAIAEPMFEDALFGHARGAFTGAVGDRPGHLAEADGGTLFLDEIGDLSVGNQVKLLRAIDLGRFRPVGARRDHESSFRTVAATNANVESLVRAGRFREDLYYRLSAVVLRVPPLADRREDIPDLVHHFARAAFLGRDIRISTEAVAALQGHDWPGNVRELRHVVEYTIGLASEQGSLSADDVGAALEDHRVSISALSGHLADAPPTFRSYERDAVELRRVLSATLREEQGSIAATARRFAVTKGTIYRWLRAVGLPTPRYTRLKPRGNSARGGHARNATTASSETIERRPTDDC